MQQLCIAGCLLLDGWTIFGCQKYHHSQSHMPDHKHLDCKSSYTLEVCMADSMMTNGNITRVHQYPGCKVLSTYNYMNWSPWRLLMQLYWACASGLEDLWIPCYIVNMEWGYITWTIAILVECRRAWNKGFGLLSDRDCPNERWQNESEPWLGSTSYLQDYWCGQYQYPYMYSKLSLSGHSQ